MNPLADYLVLGAVQGLTEFLPVSSSGHLAVLQRLMGMTQDSVALAVVLHIGSLAALAVFFFKDILKALRNRKLLMYIILVTVITGVIGVAGKDFFERLFVSPKAIAIGWLISGVVLLLTKKAHDGPRQEAGAKDACILGVTQGLAIVPGISRSGITISTLLFRKFDTASSFSLSFLMGMPAILGAALLEAKHIDLAYRAHPGQYALGFLVSFLTSFAALGILRAVMRRKKFYVFGYYCLALAVATFFFVK